MSAAFVPWARTPDERRMRRALASLDRFTRLVCEDIAAGIHHGPAIAEPALAALRTAYDNEKD